MRIRHRVAVVTATFVCAGSAFGPAVVAQADATGSFYVNNAATADCSDSTTNSADTPYCTIQAAVSAATSPGDTVIVGSGSYAPFTVTASGTAAAPITIESVSGLGFPTSPFTIVATSTGVSAVTLKGASNIVVKGLHIIETANASAVTVAGGSGDTLTDSYVGQSHVGGTAPAVSIGSGATSVTVSRNELVGTTSEGLVSAQGGSNDVVTTNVMTNDLGPAIVLSGATSSDVTSNTMAGNCGTAIDLTDGSTSASVENNVLPNMSGGPAACGFTVADEVALSVDGTSTEGTTADYNDFWLNASTAFTSVYEWAGTYYGSAAAFEAATGQGAHDADSNAADLRIDSANSDAPGELSTDVIGKPRLDDPQVANTGVGTYDYYDRGAAESVDPITDTLATDLPRQAPVGGVGTYAATVGDSWGDTLTCTYDFGDGSGAVAVTPDSSGVCSTQHVFTTTGAFSVKLVVTSTDGYSAIATFGVTVVADSALVPAATAAASGALGVILQTTGSTDSWNIVQCSVDFGDGSAPTVQGPPISGSCSTNYVYAKPGTYTITTTLTDAGGNQKAVTTTFSTLGTYFTPVTPKRILDTRNGTGVSVAAPIAPGSQALLKIAGVDGLPQSGVTAVALNVTVTEATKLGLITAFPDGLSLPEVSNVDFHAGQNVANTVIVAVGTDGYIDLENNSPGTTQIIADLEGYYSATGTSGYHAITPTRVLDTRKTTALPAGQTVKVNLGSYAGISAAVLNLTVVGATGNGYVTAAPDGGATPATSNVNYLAGQTVPNEAIVSVGADGYVDFTNSGKGNAELVVDLNGYYSAGTGDDFVPTTPARYLDTRVASGALGANQTYAVAVGGICRIYGCSPEDVPSDATAIAANLTIVSPTANGFITVFPADVATAPNASVLNFLTGQQTQNAITVGLDPSTGKFNVDNASKGYTNVVVDVFGYYSATAQ